MSRETTLLSRSDIARCISMPEIVRSKAVSPSHAAAWCRCRPRSPLSERVRRAELDTPCRPMSRTSLRRHHWAGCFTTTRHAPGIYGDDLLNVRSRASGQHHEACDHDQQYRLRRGVAPVLSRPAKEVALVDRLMARAILLSMHG